MATADATADPIADATADPTATTDQMRATLVRLLRAAYPHSRFPDGPYQRCAEAILTQAAASPYQKLAIATGLASLDARAGGEFAAMDDASALALLREIEQAPFFRFIRGVAVVVLYDDGEVHELLGYEGPAYEKGGYLHRGFDDLDWLPTPRIEEYDGPDQLVEVAEHDQPHDRSPHDEPALTGGTR